MSAVPKKIHQGPSGKLGSEKLESGFPELPGHTNTEITRAVLSVRSRRNVSTRSVTQRTPIKKDFKHLHQLLYDKEKAMLAALRKEKNQKTQLMKSKMEKINEELFSLPKTIKELRDKLDSGDVQFLQSFKDMLERAQNMNQETETVRGGLIDTAQYLGNLKFTVWSKIRESISYICDGKGPFTRIIL
ncbi:uncharacterized protein [Sinocyclocheilus grahami]|uniref:uncharacterized protein isoform X3 n=1 Tax=Sinocyclocheilus grahami TaxID=75366 RepID=UPI0007ACD83E|nr:PREDICTED: uncharacterized protein LOC107598016 isoform X3 [Sinocyclocheilus grahami]